MSRTGEDAYHTGTPGHEDHREERDQSNFLGFSDQPLKVQKHKPRGGGGGGVEIHRQCRRLFEDMQRRMEEMEQQIQDQVRLNKIKMRQMSQPLPATSGVGPTVWTSSVNPPPHETPSARSDT